MRGRTVAQALITIGLACASRMATAQEQGAAAADTEHGQLRAEVGAEYDSNAHRVEQIASSGQGVVGSFLQRLVLSAQAVGQLAPRHALAWSATGAAKIFDAPAARSENVVIAQSSLVWRATLGERSWLAPSASYYEAFQSWTPEGDPAGERRDRRHEQHGGSAEAHSLHSERGRQVAVIGSSRVEPGSEAARLAEEVGRLLAEAGVTLVCGGLTGVMEAACRGATEAGGTAIGIVPGTDASDANPFCTHVVATGIGHARNLAVVSSGEVAIAIGGEWGTLSEIGFARALGRTVVALRSWTLEGRERMEGAPGVLRAESAREAVDRALELP